MKILLIQDRCVFKCGNNYYRASIDEFIKYEEICDELIYCASVKIICEEQANKLLRIPERIQIVEVLSNDVRCLLGIRGSNYNKIVSLIDEADLSIVKVPSIFIGKQAISLLKEKNAKYIVEVIACAWDSLWYHSFKGKILAPFSYILNKYLIKNSPAAIFVTSEFLQNRYPNNNSIACSNIRLNGFNNSVLVERINKINRMVDTKTFTIATIGAVDVKCKNHELVIKALGKLRDNGYEINYYIIGGGDKTRLQKLSNSLNLHNNIHFVGLLTHDKVISFLSKIDIYVHPSKAEGLPRVVIEAMSLAIPCMVAKAAGSPELIDSNMVFDKNDSDSLVNMVENISKASLVKAAQHNFTEFTDNYTLQHLSKRRRIFVEDFLTK